MRVFWHPVCPNSVSQLILQSRPIIPAGQAMNIQRYVKRDDGDSSSCDSCDDGSDDDSNANDDYDGDRNGDDNSDDDGW